MSVLIRRDDSAVNHTFSFDSGVQRDAAAVSTRWVWVMGLQCCCVGDSVYTPLPVDYIHLLMMLLPGFLLVDGGAALSLKCVEPEPTSLSHFTPSHHCCYVSYSVG